MSKPVLYTFVGSVWAAVAEIAAAERGVDVEIKQVNLMKGENFEPTFLELNPEGTLPTLVAGPEAPHTDTKAVVSYLNRNGTSPKVAEATEFTDLIHEDKYDPNFALLLARNDGELTGKASNIPGTFIESRQSALERISATPEAAKFKKFYDEKKAANGGLLKIYKGEVPEKDKNGFFLVSSAHVENINNLITTKIAPKLDGVPHFLGGVKPNEDDFHLIGWLARIASTVFASNDADGILAYKKQLGEPVPSSVVSYWKHWVERDSFKTVYAGGLH